MSEEKLIPVNVIIGDRNYRVKITPSEEEQLRKNVKVINEKIVEFKTTLAGKDMQDYIAMVLLWHTTHYLKESNHSFETEVLKEELEKIKSLIDKTI